MSLRIERSPWTRIGVGRTKFDEDYCLKNEDDSFVPNTDHKLKRVRPVPLSERCRGFFSDEIDRLIEGLRVVRDSTPFVPPRPAVPPQFHPKRKRAQQQVSGS
jgi:hypothetical protein